MKAMTELTNTVVSFKFEVNSDLMTYFLDLLQRFVSLHFLICLVENRKMYVGAYARAHECTTNQPEPNFHSIAGLFEKLDKDRSKSVTDRVQDCLKCLVEDMAGLSRHVGETLISFSKPIKKWEQVKALVDANVFNVVEDPKTMCLPKGERNHLELMHVARFKHWVLLGFLCFPAELTRPLALQMVATCLGDMVMLEIFRDTAFNVQEAYDGLLKWYKSKDGALGSRPNRKILSSRIGWGQTQFNHHQLRVYLRLEMDSLNYFFREFPGTISPKLQMIYALLHLARDELLWYFRHNNLGKKLALSADPRISDLIYLAERLVRVVMDHSSSIQQYYHEYLQGPDTAELTPIVSNFLTQSNADTSIRTLLGLIMQGIKTKKSDQSFDAIRLNWYRCSAAVNGIQSGCRPPEIAALSTPVAKMIMHTRNVDCIKQQLKTHGGWAPLYWFREQVERELASTLNGVGNARNAVSLVVAMGEAMDNVHRICPEEQPVIGRAVTNLVDNMLKEISDGVEKLVKNIALVNQKLRNETESAGIINMLKERSALPGSESNGNDNQEMQRMRLYKRSLAQICAAVQECGTMVVFNYEFCPREYVFESISKNLRRRLQDCCMIPSSEKKGLTSLRRPSLALTRFNVVVQTYQIIEEYLSFKLSDVVRSILLGEFTDPRCGGAGESLFSNAGSSASSDQKVASTTVHLYSQWFQKMFRDNPASIGVVFSPKLKSFWGLKVSNRGGGGDSVLMDAETKTDYIELRALCKLLGPYGVRVIEKQLLTQAADAAAGIKVLITTSIKALKAFSGRSQFPTDFALARKTPGLSDEELKRLLDKAVVIGVVLEFRKLLKQALLDVTAKAVPFIHGTVTLAHRHAHDLFKISIREIYPLDLLARDAGIDGVDLPLHEALLKLKTKPEDAEVWSLLPEIFAIAMSSSFWTNSEYEIATEAHRNNAHCMAETIRSLIEAFTTIQVAGTQIDPPHVVDKRVTEMCERFVMNASNVLLHTAAAAQKTSMISIAEGVVFLETFVYNSNGRVDISFLEECFPFTLVRTTFIRIYEQQTSKGRRYELKDTEDAS
eukprot:gb/GEZN01000617.1/.p1 GENE.gb/GEZN01000617.1/~~gb/GEZN01000617.1/.p1  ORF type:complete len:1171 (-),score=225.38 gb/GEZN01000617.1/:498-3695(-)